MLAAPDVAHRILVEALQRARLAEVPESGIALETFTYGALRDSVEWSLGDDFADAFLDDVAPLLAHMGAAPRDGGKSRVRISVSPEFDGFVDSRARTDVELEPDVTAEFDVTDSAFELDDPDPTLLEHGTRVPVRVVVASRSDARVAELRAALGPTSTVQRVDDVFDLVDSARAGTHDAIVVVLDGVEPAVRATTLAAAAGELPAEARVVLWGAPAAETAELESFAPDSAAWLRIAETTSPTELAFFVRYAMQGQPPG